MREISREETKEYRELDRRAVHAGTVVTAVATVLLFVVPDVVPVEAFKQWYFDRTGTWLGNGNPFSRLRLLG